MTALMALDAKLRLARTLVVTHARHDDVAAFTDALLGAGADIVQFRDPEASADQLAAAVEAAQRTALTRNKLVAVTGDVDLARRVLTDVLVLGSRDLDPAAAHARLHEYALVGVPAYEPRDCDEAARSQADFALVGPVYVRDSSSVSASGLDLVRAAARSLPVHDATGTPWFAVGGITPQRIDAVIDAGARRAGIVVSGEQDLDAVRQVATALRTSWEADPTFADFAFRVLSGPTKAAGLASRQEPTTW